MGCSFSSVRSDTGNEDITVKNSFDGPNVQVTALTVSSDQETVADVVRRKQQTEIISAISNPTYTNEEDQIITGRGDSNLSLTSSSELRDSKDNQHGTTPRENSSSGYGGSEVSGRSSLESTTVVSNSNNGLKVDAILQRLSSIKSCSTENDSRSSAADSTSIRVPRPVKEKGMNGYFGHKSKLKQLHSDCIQRNFRYIKDELSDTVVVVDHLIQAGDLDEDDHDEIQMAGSRRKQVDLLLRKLLTSHTDAYDHFVESLRQIGRQDMVDVLSDDNIRITDIVPVIQDNAPGKEAILHAKDNFLVRELKPDLILDFFFQNRTFSLDEYESVSVRKTRKQKAQKLTKLIRKKLPWGYYDLLYALRMTQTFHIIEELVLPYQGDERLSMACGCSELTNVCCCAASGKFMMNQHAIDSSEIKIEVHLCTKNGQRLTKLERRINEHLNDSEGDDVRELLLKHAKCGFVGANMGSIIIRLRPYSTTSMKTIKEFCRRGCIPSLIMKILKARKLLSHLPEGEINIDIKVEGFDHAGMKSEELNEDVGQIERQQTDAVEMVRRNRSYLLEELDIYRVVKASLDKKIFTDSEIQKINECFGKGRRKTTEMFIECLLQKGSIGCDHFLEVLKRTKQITIMQYLQENDAYSGQLCSLKENLVDHFQMVADEIDPMDFEEVFLERKILPRRYFLNLREKFSRNRRSRAIYFIKTILDQGAGALKAFLDGLVQEGHDQIVKMLYDPTITKESNPTLEEYNLEADFEIEEVSVEETIAKGAIFAGKVEVIVKRAPNPVEKKVTKQTDVGSSNEVYSKAKDTNDDDEGMEVTEELSEYHHKKKKHRVNKRGNRPRTLPIQTFGDANGTAGSGPTRKIKKASTFPKHRKDDDDDKDANSPLTPGDSGYMGSQSSKQNLVLSL